MDSELLGARCVPKNGIEKSKLSWVTIAGWEGHELSLASGVVTKRIGDMPSLLPHRPFTVVWEDLSPKLPFLASWQRLGNWIMIETGPLGTKWSTWTVNPVPMTSKLPQKIETSSNPWTAIVRACFRWGTIRNAQPMAPTASTASWKAMNSAPFSWPRKSSPWTTMRK